MSSQLIKSQVSELGPKAAPVFQRKEFKKYAVWVGIYGHFTSRISPSERGTIDVVIFYDSKVSEDEVWDWYLHCDKSALLDDPEEFKLALVWGRKARATRIFEGTLCRIRDLEGIFYGQTIYGDFNNPALRDLRSFYHRRLEEFSKRVKECMEIVSPKRKPDSSMVSKPLMDIFV
jgi:hypothetical protein